MSVQDTGSIMALLPINEVNLVLASYVLKKRGLVLPDEAAKRISVMIMADTAGNVSQMRVDVDWQPAKHE